MYVGASMINVVVQSAVIALVGGFATHRLNGYIYRSYRSYEANLNMSVLCTTVLHSATTTSRTIEAGGVSKGKSGPCIFFLLGGRNLTCGAETN